MTMKKTAGARIFIPLLSALLLAGLLRFSSSVCPESEETEYIVKYRESLSRAEPFDVVSERELERLLRADLLE